MNEERFKSLDKGGRNGVIGAYIAGLYRASDVASLGRDHDLKRVAAHVEDSDAHSQWEFLKVLMHLFPNAVIVALAILAVYLWAPLIVYVP